YGKQSQRQRRPQNAACAECRCRKALRKEERIERAADGIDEKSQSKHTEHNRGYTGKIVDGDPHQTNSSALLSIFPKIERGKHAEGSYDEAHDDDHHDGSKNGRENAAFSVGFSGFGAEDSPHVREIDPALVREAHLIRA